MNSIHASYQSYKNQSQPKGELGEHDIRWKCPTGQKVKNAIKINYLIVTKNKKEEIWLSPMTKAPTSTEKIQKHRDNIKKPPKLRLHNDFGPTYDGQFEQNHSSPSWRV